MEITLYRNESEPNKINKSLTAINTTMIGYLRNETDVVNPVVRIEGDIDALIGVNYAYINHFDRYYFVTDMRSVRNNIIDISLHSDPLMSFDIANVTGIVTEKESGVVASSSNNYLSGRNWINTAKDKTDIIRFSNGLLDFGEYILITAGG